MQQRMNPEQFFNEILQARKRVESLQALLDAAGGSSSSVVIPSRSLVVASKVELSVETIIDLETEIETARDDFERLSRRGYEVISNYETDFGFSDGIIVLRGLFVFGLKPQELASSMGYSVGHIRRLKHTMFDNIKNYIPFC